MTTFSIQHLSVIATLGIVTTGCSHEQVGTELTAEIQLPLVVQRFGGAPDEPLGAPISVAVGDDDRVYVADELPARILAFDSVGGFLYAVGRQGDGPGEFRTPLVGAAKGFVVHDPRLGRLTAYDADGRLLWTKPGPCCLNHAVRIDREGRIYALASPVIIGGGPRWDELVVFDAAGNPLDTLRVERRGADPTGLWTVVSAQAALSAPIPFRQESYFVVTRAGTVLRTGSEGYTLVEGRDGRDTLRVVTPDWTPIQLPSTVRRAAVDERIDGLRQFVDSSTLATTFRLDDVPDVAPAVFGIDVDACGRWWVQRSTSVMGPRVGFDVFDSTGVQVGAVSVLADLPNSGPWAVGAGVLAVITEDTDGAPTLSIFRIVGVSPCMTG